MFQKIFLLELRNNLKSPAFYIFLVILFGGTLAFTLTTDPNTTVMGVTHGKEWHNAPIIIAQLMTRLGVMSLLFTMVMIGRAVAKDFEFNIHELMFSRPVSKLQYLGGRFAGAFVANLLIFAGIFLGFETGVLILAPQYSGPFRIGSYLLPMFLIIVPNLLLMGGVLFSLATLSRKMISTYLAGVGMLAVYGIVSLMLQRIDNETVKVLLDPFGITALTVYSKFWTVSDMNTFIMPVTSALLMNRLLWIAVSIAILAYTYRRFRFIAFLEKKSKPTMEAVKPGIPDRDIPAPVITIRTTKMFTFSQCIAVSWRDFRRIVVHPAFLILTALAIMQMVTNFMGDLGNSTGNMYPFTSWYIRQTLHLWMYMMPMTIFFAGMLVWKEKDHGTDEIINTLPIPNWFSYANKLMTLAGINTLYLILGIIAGVVTQVAVYDFWEVELGLYFKQLFGVDFFNYLHIAIIVLFIQNLSPNKYMGFFLSAMYFMADMVVFGVFGFDNYLFRIGRVPEYIYSNLNGFGHYGALIFWYTLYWLFFGGIMAWLTILLWKRTNENSIGSRFAYLKKHITREQAGGLTILLVLFVIAGSFIGFNKYILNPYFSEHDSKKMQADYEKKFRVYARMPQPTIRDIKLKVDLFPEERTVNVSGKYLLLNNLNKPVKEICVNLDDWNLSNMKALGLSRRYNEKVHAQEFGFRVFELDQALLPGDTLTLYFKYDIIARGFTENQPKNEIARNGTCLSLSGFSSSYFPMLGYNVNEELLDDKDRKKFGLPAKADAPKLKDAKRENAMIGISWTDYDAIISTSSDQKAVSGGRLVKQWKDKGRNYFRYKSDAPIMSEIVILSGRYEVRREQYKDVNVEVYYHPRHNYNISRIMAGLKDSYDYGNRYFSTYPYHDLRVVEIPNYMKEGAARHFPTTFIWIESEGFTTRYEEGDIDIVYGIAAHENAHHWWAGIVTPAYSEGAFMLTETICQYVMAMLTEQEYGKEVGRKYVNREMKSYLTRRKKDTEGEKPLIECSVQQDYLGYKKSSAVMYALQDYISEDSVGKALERMVNKFGNRLDTFALASDLVNEFYKVTPDSMKYLVSDLFEKITLYENKINSASCRTLLDGRYQITLSLNAAKYYADSVGNQLEVPMHDYIYVALMDEKGEAIYYQKHLFTRNSTTIKITTTKKPAKAGIDPYLVLIDRTMDDNTCSVKDVKGETPLSFLLNLSIKSAVEDVFIQGKVWENPANRVIKKVWFRNLP